MKQLSNSELEIMVKLWDAEKPMSFEEIHKAVEERNWEESTVRSFIQRMMTKGVHPKRSGWAQAPVFTKGEPKLYRQAEPKPDQQAL